MKIDIDRIHIAMQGVSAAVVEAAMQDLGEELQRRLGVLRAAESLPGGTLEIAELAIGPLQMTAQTDAAALRALIAQGLVEMLATRMPDNAKQQSAQP